MSDPNASTTRPEFSIVVLCYRAEDEIVPFVERLHKLMSLYAMPWEIVLVANYWPGAEDRTPAITAELASSLPNVRRVAEPKAGGMGYDMRTGLDACRGRILGVIDGDGQFPMDAICSCFSALICDDLDFVKTYRVIRFDGLLRNLLSYSYNLFFKILFPRYWKHRDVNSKPKLLKRSLYERLELTSDDWFADAEMVLGILKLEVPIAEVPIRFRQLGRRKSFVRFSAVYEFLVNLVVYRLTGRVLGKRG